MNIFKGLLDKITNKAALGAAPHAGSALGLFKYGATKYALGAAAGSIAGLVRGDNYNSTETMKNAIGGALLGVGGVGAATAALKYGPGLISRVTGLRQVMNASAGGRMAAFRSSPLGHTLGIANKAGGMAIGLGAAIARHPALAFTGAILGGTAAYLGSQAMAPGVASPDINNAELTQMNSQSLTSFQASTQNLTFGLNRRRHR